jgi:hypothetical protein
MTAVQLNFNAANYEPLEAFDVLPSGWQNAAITDTEMKPTADGQGQYLWLEHTIIDGPYKGRKVFNNLNIVNPNPATVEIAYKTLSAICKAVGVGGFGSTTEIMNRQLKIKIKKRDGRKDETTGKEYDASNEVKGYDHINSDHPLEHTVKAGGVAGAPQGQPVWANQGASSPTAAPPVAAGPALGQQPWQQPPPPAPPLAAPPAPPAPPAVDPLIAAQGDGWVQHPSSAVHFYRGQEVVTTDDLRARYAAPLAPPAIPAAPPVPGVPQQASQPAAGGQKAPWLQ